MIKTPYPLPSVFYAHNKLTNRIRQKKNLRNSESSLRIHLYLQFTQITAICRNITNKKFRGK